MSAGRLLLLVALACCTASIQADLIGYQELDSFRVIGTGVTFTGRVESSGNQSFGFQWIGREELAAQFIVRVTDEALYLDMASDDNTVYQNVSGYYLVTVPSGSLNTLRSYGNNTITLAGSTMNKTTDFLAVSRGAGQTYLTNVTTVDLQVENYGVGDIIIDGELEKVQYRGNGAGSLFLNGSKDDVQVSLRGSGNVNINSSVDIDISGSSLGTSQIHYNRGSCTVTSPAMPVCQLSGSVSQPPVLAPTTSELSSSIESATNASSSIAPTAATSRATTG